LLENLNRGGHSISINALSVSATPKIAKRSKKREKEKQFFFIVLRVAAVLCKRIGSLFETGVGIAKRLRHFQLENNKELEENYVGLHKTSHKLINTIIILDRVLYLKTCQGFL
jgi:hypothetical protein